MRYTAGHVEKLKPPRKGWRAVLSYKDINGKTKRKTKMMDARTKTQAERQMRVWWTELEAMDDEQEAAPKALPTVGELIDAHVDTAESTRSIGRSTAENYRKSKKRMPKKLMDTSIGELTFDMVSKMESDLLEKGYAPTSVVKCHRLLKMCLRGAVEDGLIDKNPVDRVKPPKLVPVKKGINALASDEREKLKARLSASAPTPVVMAATIALYTGMRRGEICGLRWSDIDFDKGVIWVRRAVETAGGETAIKDTKTGRARDISMPSTLSKLLNSWRDKGAGGQVYVIGHQGEYASPDVISHEWRSLASTLNLVGIEGRLCTFHDLRHTWATVAVAADVDIKTVSSTLGHANAAVTLNIYASADPDAKRRAADTMDSVI